MLRITVIIVLIIGEATTALRTREEEIATVRVEVSYKRILLLITLLIVLIIV